MPRLVLEAAPMELGLNREQYDALLADLAAQGYDVELAPQEEYRSVPDPATFYNLVVRVGELAGSIATVSALISLLRKHLRGRNAGRTRRGIVYLPNGDQHRFDMPDE